MTRVSNTPVGPLLKVVFASILEVFLLCLSGYILAGRGILDKKTQKQINRLNVSLFTPALLFSKVAFYLSPEKLRELWIIPLFFMVVTLVSMTVAFILGTLCRLKRSQRNFAMAAAMFMNSNSLPIALMQSLVLTVHDLKWGKGDNADCMLGRALTYLVLYSTLGMVVRWSYGVKLLSQADDESQDKEHDEQTPLLSSQNSPPASYDGTLTTPPPGTGQQKKRSPQHLAPFFYSFPNTPTMSRSELSDESPSSSTTVSVTGPDEDPSSDANREQPQRFTLPCFRRSSGSHSQRRFRRAIKAINDFMTAPLWAAAASLVVACIPSFQHALDKHMEPVKGAISSAGQCSIPLTLIILGAYFYPTPSEEQQDNKALSTHRESLLHNLRTSVCLNTTNESGVDRRSGETSTVLVAVVSRMLITPLVLIPLMAVGSKLVVQDVFSDPVFVVSNVLLLSSPPALTLAQITQAASGDAFERLISRTIFWSYCIVTPPMTIAYVMIGLILAKL